ncbi:lipoprotein [Streptomyces noursei]|uniref:lipoprotein n=1 Tax=Streptomyces noursei TaxID=1971 RepID=UPI0023B7A579|nr:lipoprotein [Streptomyces noursei]
MSSRVRRWSAGLLGPVLLAGASLGCSRDEGEHGAEGEHVASVGGARSACELPVAFEIPTPWKKSSDGNTVDEERSSRYASCDLELGSGKTKTDLWVVVYDKGRASADPLKALLDHDGYGMNNYGEYYRGRYENRLTVAGHSAAEMGYTVTPPTADDESFHRRMLSVSTPDATIVLGVGADNPGADDRTRKALDRVKSSLRMAP